MRFTLYIPHVAKTLIHCVNEETLWPDFEFASAHNICSSKNKPKTKCHTFPLNYQVICGQNCTFVIQANGTVLACGEGSYGRLGQGNSDDLHVLTVISALQGKRTKADVEFGA